MTGPVFARPPPDQLVAPVAEAVRISPRPDIVDPGVRCDALPSRIGKGQGDLIGAYPSVSGPLQQILSPIPAKIIRNMTHGCPVDDRVVAQYVPAVAKGIPIKRLAWRAIFASLWMLVFASCTFEPETPFRVGSNLWPGYQPLYLARELGHYADSDIRLVELPNASEVIQALRNGTLEAAALTLDEALTIAQDGHDLRVVLVMDFSHGGDALLATPAIEHLGQLRGRRIGVENTAVGAILLDAALSQAGLSTSDVMLVSLTVDEHLEAFRSGQVDAIVTFEPVTTQILASGGRKLFDSREIPNRIVDVLVVPAEVADRRSASVQHLVSGYFAALAQMQTRPTVAAEHLAQRMQMPVSEAAKISQGIYQPGLVENHALLGSSTATLRKPLRELITLMKERGMLHREPDTTKLLAATWLPAEP